MPVHGIGARIAGAYAGDKKIELKVIKGSGGEHAVRRLSVPGLPRATARHSLFTFFRNLASRSIKQLEAGMARVRERLGGDAKAPQTALMEDFSAPEVSHFSPKDDLRAVDARYGKYGEWQAVLQADPIANKLGSELRRKFEKRQPTKMGEEGVTDPELAPLKAMLEKLGHAKAQQIVKELVPPATGDILGWGMAVKVLSEYAAALPPNSSGMAVRP